MRPIAGVALGLVVAVAAGGPADDKGGKIDAKKLVGKWEPKEQKKDARITIEFTKDGKMNITAARDGKEDKVVGSYKLEGDQLAIHLKVGEKEAKDTVTVTKLTDDEWEGKGKDGKLESFKRVKAK